MKRRIALLLPVVLFFACTSIYQRRGTEGPLVRKTGANESEVIRISVKELEGDSVDARLRQLDWEARSVEKFDTFEMGVVEVTDEGQTNPAQISQVMDMVKDRAKDEKRGLLLVVFVHGWHHGPGVCDRDICCFRRVLDRLARMEGLAGKVNVTGIYIGWRGESIENDKLSNFSFWDRKSTAQYVGSTGAKEFLLSLDELYRDVKNKTVGNTKYVKMVTVGHSFGGALVFNIMKRLATGNVAEVLDPSKDSFRVIRAESDRVEAAKRGEKAIRARLGDLVVLVNPAIEASQWDVFDNDLPDTSYPAYVAPDKALPYSPNQLPVLITVASQADKAVGVAFPAGRWLSAIIYPSIAKKSSRRIGMGHYEPHITHTLDYSGTEIAEVPKVQCGCTMDFESEKVKMTPGDKLSLYTRAPQTLAGGKIKFELAPRHVNTWDIHSPFLVVSATGRVIAAHSDIYNPVFVSFLQKYIQAYVVQSVTTDAVAATTAEGLHK